MDNKLSKYILLASAVAFLSYNSLSYADKSLLSIGADGLNIGVGGIDFDIDGDYVEKYPTPKVGKSYVNADLEGVDFSHSQLAWANFTNADLIGVNFRGADLTKAVFKNATLINCDLRGSIVDGTDFTNVDFEGSKLSSVDFSRANMTNVDIDAVDISQSTSLSANYIGFILTRQDEVSPRLNLDIRFSHDSYNVEPSSMQQIEDLAKALTTKRLLGKKIMLEGHTDSNGEKLYNLNLSQRRAESIINILVNNYGLDKSLLDAKGFGESHPVYSNKTAFGKSVNRRVTVVFSD